MLYVLYLCKDDGKNLKDYKADAWSQQEKFWS